jgi:hypothetical protein
MPSASRRLVAESFALGAIGAAAAAAGGASLALPTGGFPGAALGAGRDALGADVDVRDCGAGAAPCAVRARNHTLTRARGAGAGATGDVTGLLLIAGDGGAASPLSTTRKHSHLRVHTPSKYTRAVATIMKHALRSFDHSFRFVFLPARTHSVTYQHTSRHTNERVRNSTASQITTDAYMTVAAHARYRFGIVGRHVADGVALLADPPATCRRALVMDCVVPCTGVIDVRPSPVTLSHSSSTVTTSPTASEIWLFGSRALNLYTTLASYGHLGSFFSSCST